MIHLQSGDKFPVGMSSLRPTDLRMLSMLRNLGPDEARVKKVFGSAQTVNHGMSQVLTGQLVMSACHIKWIELLLDAKSSSVFEQAMDDIVPTYCKISCLPSYAGTK